MGAYLSQPVTAKESHDGENGLYKFGVSAMQGWRTGMEDAHSTLLALDGSTALFGVFDGHGGREVAAFSARHLPEELVKLPAYKAGNLEQGLKDAFLKMDEMMMLEPGRKELLELADVKESGATGSSEQMRKVRGMLMERLGLENPALDAGDDEDDLANPAVGGIPEAAGAAGAAGAHGYTGPAAGCTAVVALVRGNVLTVANAGDSRAVICRRGVATPLSEDHKPTLEGERARILKAGGFVSEGRVNGSLALSRALGDMEYKQNKALDAGEQIVTALPEVKIMTLQDGDEFMVLACDGIWDVMTSQQCVDFVRTALSEGKPPSAICEALCDECMAPSTTGANGIGCDNMSAVLVVFKGTSAPKM